MQSFMTVFIAGILAFMGVFMMSPEPSPQVDVFAEAIAIEENIEIPIIPSVIVRQDIPLVLALDAYTPFQGGVYLPTDVLIAYNE